MKKILLSLFVLASLQSFAQITLEHAHIIATGRQYTEAFDNSLHRIPASGANKVWDYSNLKADDIDSVRFGLPKWYKGYTHFPTSNYAFIFFSDTSEVGFATLTPTAFILDGNFSSSDTTLQIFHRKLKLYEFPSTYNHQFSETELLPGLSIGIGIDPDSAGPLPKVDSLQISTNIVRHANMNGWGTLKTPLGTFNALKQSTLVITRQEVMIFANGVWIKANPVILNFLNITLPEPDSLYDVSFMTNSGGIGVPLMTLNHSPKDTVTNTFTWVNSMPRKSNVASIYQNSIAVYPNPFNTSITIEMPGYHTCQILNTLGQVVAEHSINEKEQIDLESYSNGIYFLKVFNSENELIHSEKIIKN